MHNRNKQFKKAVKIMGLYGKNINNSIFIRSLDYTDRILKGNKILLANMKRI